MRTHLSIYLSIAREIERKEKEKERKRERGYIYKEREMPVTA
jgi:hypothetical protein